MNDETGADIFGDDEIKLRIVVDGELLYEGSWNDADTGERWPRLAEHIRQQAATFHPIGRSIAFARDISLTYSEGDFGLAAAGQLANLYPLGPSSQAMKERRVSLSVPDPVSDGHYTFYCTLSKFP